MKPKKYSTNFLVNVKMENKPREKHLIYLINDFRLKQNHDGIPVANNFDALEMLIFKALDIKGDPTPR